MQLREIQSKSLIDLTLTILICFGIVTNSSAQQYSIDYATFLGGSSWDVPRFMEVENCETYLFSYSQSSDFNPITNGSTFTANRDVVLTKLDSANNIVFSIYLGSERFDYPIDLKVEGDNIFILTSSYNGTTFPVTDGSTLKGSSDIIFSRLDANTGALEFSTFLGGDGIDDGINLVCENGALYLAAITSSDNFPVTDGSSRYTSDPNDEADLVLVKMDSSANIDFATYVGPYSTENFGNIYMEVVNGEVYFSLITDYDDYPVTDGSTKTSDGAVVVHKLDANGQTVYAFYLVQELTAEETNFRSEFKNGKYFLLLDEPEGNVNQSVITNSTVYQQGSANFLFTVVDGNTGQITFATYIHLRDVHQTVGDGEAWLIGQADNETQTALHFDCTGNVLTALNTFPGNDLQLLDADSNNIYLVSKPSLEGLPTTDGTVMAGNNDLVITKLDHEGNINTLSYLGGLANSSTSIDFQIKENELFLTTALTTNSSSTYPVTEGSSNLGSSDIYYARLDFCPDFIAAIEDTLSPTSQLTCQNGLVRQIKGVPIAISGKDLPIIYRAGIPFNQNDISAAYQWQESSSPNGPWTDILGATQVNYTPKPVVENRYFRRLSFSSECCGKDTISISQVDTILVNDFTAPIVNAGGVFNTCPGVAVTLDATITGGTAPYVYDWDMGATDVEDPTVSITQSTVFTLLVTDDNNCEQLGQAVVNTYSADAGPPSAGACAGDPVLIGGRPIPGVSGVVYDWTPIDSLSCTDCAQAFARPDSTTTYVLELTIPITGGGTCQTTDSIEVIPITAPESDFAGPDITICRGQTSTIGMPAEYFPLKVMEVSQSSSASGYTGIVDNLTDNDFTSGARTNSQSNPWVVIDLGQIYSNVTRVDLAAINTSNLNGRELHVSADSSSWQYVKFINGVSNTALTSYTFIPRDARYIRVSRIGTLAIDLSEIIVYQSYGYTWAPGNYLTLNNRAEVTFKPGNLALPNPNPILYYLTAEREGCTFTDDMLAHVIEARAWVDGCGPRIVGEPDRTPNIDETYEWVLISGPGNFTGATDQAQVPVSASVGGNSVYEVRVSHGGTTCTDQVVVPPTCGCVVDIAVAAPNACPSLSQNEGEVVLTAFGSVDPSLDPNNFTYTWSIINGPPGGLDTYTGQQVKLTDTIERTYRVSYENTGSPALLCTRDISVNNPAWSLPVFNAPDVSTCANDPVTIGEPPVTDYSYEWQPANNLDDETISLPTTTVNTNTEFTITITDTRSGCITIDTVEVQTTSVAANAGQNILLCDNGVISIGNNPAVPEASYVWTPNNANWQNGTNHTHAQPDVLVGIDQEFILEVTNTLSNCVTRDTMMVTVGNPITPFTLPDIAYCPSDGAVSLGATIPAGFSSYEWSPANLLVDESIQSPTTTNPPPSSETTFTVIVRNSSGCEYQTSQKIIPSIGSPDAGSSKIICLGESTTIGSPNNLTGVGINYSWTGSATGDLSSTVDPNPTFNPSNSGVFQFTVEKDDNGCISTATVSITVNEYQIQTIEPITICQGASQQIGVTPESGVQYFWSPTDNLSDATIANPIVTGLTTTTSYTLSAIGLNGCATSVDVVVGVNPVPTPDVSIADTIICFGNTVTSFQPSIQSIGNYNYVWSPNDGSVANIYNPNSDILIFETGEKEYTLLVTDTESGCGVETIVNLLVTNGCDWGDLPDISGERNSLDYQTLQSNNGPVHIIIPGLSLGTDVDREVNGQPNSNALGDGADENGFPSFSSAGIAPGDTILLDFTATNITGDTAFVEMWVDWNGDGDFLDMNEFVIDIDDGTQAFPSNLEMIVPTNVVTEQPFGLRMRISQTDNMTPYGRISTGEVEDYLLLVNDCRQLCLPIIFEVRKGR